MIYRFGDYTLDTQAYELRLADEAIAIEPQVFDVLQHLIENCDRVVSKDDLIASVWSGRIVSDATLSSRINAARHAVGDSGKSQKVIKTVQRRGFRFVAPIEEIVESLPPQSRPRSFPQTIRYCATRDGVDLAYSFAGSGLTLLKVASWLNHIEYDWSSPIWAPLFGEFAAYRQLLRYDSRGVGLSDWNAKKINFDLLVDDLEAVIAASGV